MIKKTVALIALVIIVIGALYIWGFYNNYKGSSILKNTIIFIPTGSNYETVLYVLDTCNCLKNLDGFNKIAEVKSYPQLVKPGRYFLKKGMSNEGLVNKLRIGNQDAIKFTFNNLRTINQLAGRAAYYLETDSLSFLNYLYNPETISKYGFTKNQFPAMFIPNTYAMHWNTTPEKFAERMAKEFKIFWSDENRAKAKSLGLSQSEVATLASIVESETKKNDEKPRVAGVYINRIKKGMPLQADPTLIFALGDFSIKRVTNKDKKINSLYNTYKYKGLPPGPIRLPEISSINAVLNYEKHAFIYFCAREDFSGYHNFTSSYRQHKKNATLYHNALNKRKIYR